MFLRACVLLTLIFGAGVADAPSNDVVVVLKTHYDLGYTDLASNVIEEYKTTMIDKALAVCDANDALPAEQRFVWTIPGWPMAEILKSAPAPRMGDDCVAGRVFCDAPPAVYDARGAALT